MAGNGKDISYGQSLLVKRCWKREELSGNYDFTLSAEVVMNDLTFTATYQIIERVDSRMISSGAN